VGKDTITSHTQALLDVIFNLNEAIYNTWGHSESQVKLLVAVGLLLEFNSDGIESFTKTARRWTSLMAST